MYKDIKELFDSNIAKKIFGNKDNACEYLVILDKIAPIDNLYNSKGKVNKTLDIWKTVVETWNYDTSKTIIRDLFKQTKKYSRGNEANDSVTLLRAEWQKMNLGEFSWPFSQGDFDNFVQHINSSEESGLIKDDKVKTAAVKFRRIKEINTYRNDYIETLIFEHSDAIIPTLGHKRGVDFFINGISFDQKVSKSTTNEFKTAYRDNWRDKAIENPAEVAKFLYKYQDEGRFGSDPRLLIVYLDEDITADEIEQIVKTTKYDEPLKISFDYQFKSSGKTESYSTLCIVILLHK